MNKYNCMIFATGYLENLEFVHKWICWFEYYKAIIYFDYIFRWIVCPDCRSLSPFGIELE